MNRILPVLLVAGAVCLHFLYCEWDIRRDTKGVSQSQNERTIYFNYKVHRSTYVLAKPGYDRDEAEKFGVWLPAALIGVAATVSFFQRGGKVSDVW